MKQYTVVGVNDSNSQTFCLHVEANDPHEAMSLVSVNVLKADADYCVIGAIEGNVELVSPDEDSGKAAYASDLAGVGVPRNEPDYEYYEETSDEDVSDDEDDEDDDDEEWDEVEEEWDEVEEEEEES